MPATTPIPTRTLHPRRRRRDDRPPERRPEPVARPREHRARDVAAAAERVERRARGEERGIARHEREPAPRAAAPPEEEPGVPRLQVRRPRREPGGETPQTVVIDERPRLDHRAEATGARRHAEVDVFVVDPDLLV